VVKEARHFFDLIFSQLVRWENSVLPFRRGAWLRVYGIPLHAWNETFFNLCVFDCGSFLRSDNCSLARKRFDYARVLVSTSSFEVINVSEHIVIDGVLMEIKIIEEWGFNMGEDACLFEEVEKSVASEPGSAEFHDDFVANKNVNDLVDKIVKDLVEVEDENHDCQNINNREENFETAAPATNHVPLVFQSGGPNSHKLASQDAASVSINGERSLHADLSASLNKDILVVFSDGKLTASGAGGSNKASTEEVSSRKRRALPVSCSQASARSSRTGPWSVEWLHNIQGADVGLISSKKKRMKKVMGEAEGVAKGNTQPKFKKKAGRQGGASSSGPYSQKGC